MSVEPHTRSSGCRLTEIPSELLGCILAEIETARTLSYLSLTCKALHAYIERHGYRIFFQKNFPSITLPSLHAAPFIENGKIARYSKKFWKDATHGLTTLSRNFDRRAFVAQDIKYPGSERIERVRGFFRRHRIYGPRMGFVPIIDSYEVWYGSDWASRKEVVAWGEGANLVIRTRDTGRWREDVCDEVTHEARKLRWQTYIKEGVHEGLDDITTLNLLLCNIDSREKLLVGRASGGLEQVLVDEEKGKRKFATYETGGMPVRYTTVHHRDSSVAAACLGDHSVALYHLNCEGDNIKSYHDTSIRKEGEKIRTWSAKFLREGRFAVGLGRSTQPINIFDLGQSSLAIERAIEISFDNMEKLNQSESSSDSSLGTSVYSIASLPPSSTSSGAEGDVFLSGAYDAHIRLHDLRLANTVVSMYSDPIDANSAIYSLLSIGRERFVAGGAQHSLMKVYDLRMPGQRVYHAADALPCSQKSPSSTQGNLSQASISCSISRSCPFHASFRTPRNWNLFLTPRPIGYNDSSVYSLSRPSSVSPVIYAGLQDRITQIDIVSILDRHPDTCYDLETSPVNPLPEQRHTETPRATSRTTTLEDEDLARRWDPQNRALNFAMYEQADTVILMHQRPIQATYSALKAQEQHCGLDERWRKGSTRLFERQPFPYKSSN